MERDWKTNPPKTREDAFLLAEYLCQPGIDKVYEMFGMRGWTERRANSVVVVWEDGAITNEIEIEMIQ